MQRESYSSKFDFYKGRHGPGNCGYCGKPCPGRRRNWCSDECVIKIFLESKDWGQTRITVFKRDGWKCRQCGRSKRRWTEKGEWTGEGAVLHCDHIIPVEVAPEKQWDLENLQTLCADCHKKKTRLDMQAIARARQRSRRERGAVIVPMEAFSRVQTRLGI